MIFSVVAKKSRTFTVSRVQLMSRCGAGREQIARTGSQAGQWKYSIPWASCQFRNGGLPGGRKLLALLLFQEFESSHVWEFELFQEVGCFQEFCELLENRRVWRSVITAQGLAADQSLGGGKIVLYVVYFAYSLLPILFLLVVVVLVFPLLSY